ncbi:heme-thiolate peroxidase aromatic peroxygenase like protein [Zymoseptoria brevis]|uniref:Heme-thiolate peroxidase aromatic peroxygenase like protein n=1 Tax=Zymoseptoria brevis TaxID=1047168 RepID=A0A0F4GBT1_9PEZI|nr:heme-thiolate peroxidase aromatic peroxygenase like protein [Zymoseptoria brevis]
MGIIGNVGNGLVKLTVMAWDNVLAVANLVTPKLKEGHVVPKGVPGHNGKWPEYIAPKDGDSRSACPMINAMANHGILPRDGKNITFKELNKTVRQTFNFADSFCFFVPKFAADFLNKSYSRDTFDLAELSLHAPNAIEHDASLTRHDAALQPDQSKPDLQLVDELLKEATQKTTTGAPQMTKTDLSRALSKRRAEARSTNKDYTESKFHNLFGSANSATMLTIYGGLVEDLRPMLTEERFTEGWEPRIHDRFGLTMAKFNFTVLPVEHKIDVKPYAKQEN